MKGDDALLQKALLALESIELYMTLPQDLQEVIQDLRYRLDLCPKCGAQIVENYEDGWVSGVETFWDSCNKCGWVGE
jgi:predicted RNA-binding Zn-ribbon protein involved in translation (DUF1610 family)